jgi:hypothetical protein
MVAREGMPLQCRHNCEVAAQGGQLEVLQWLHKLGFPWSEEGICAAAASGDHLDVLEWARENGCPEHTE